MAYFTKAGRPWAGGECPQTTKGVAMGDMQLTLTLEEREYLKSLPSELIKEKLVEEHRTRKLSYRSVVVDEENVIQGLLKKLG
jgi:hypothetical protein